LKPDLLELIHRVETTTEANTEFHLNIAFNYGGRDADLQAAISDFQNRERRFGNLNTSEVA